MTHSLHKLRVVMSSQITPTQSSSIHPFAHMLDTCALIFSSCTIFTIFPNRIMLRHPTHLHLIISRARDGGPKELRAKQNGRVKLNELQMYQCSPFFSTFAHYRAATTVIPLLPCKANLTPSIQPNLGLSRTRPSLKL